MSSPDSKTLPPEPVTPLRQHAIPKLSERAMGLMTYQVGLGTSGTVYVAIVGNENGGYFSREWLPVPRILDTIHSRLDTENPTFPTRLLRSAFVNRSNNNGGFLAALLRHEALLVPGELPHLHRCRDDWDTWIEQQRKDFEAGVRLEVPEEAPESAMPATPAKRRTKR